MQLGRVYVLIQCTSPTEAILSWKFPQAGLPPSKHVSGAFVHTLVLTEQNVSVVVRMHAKVRSCTHLRDVSMWRVEHHELCKGELHLTLVPASGSRPTVRQLKLELESKKHAHVQLVPFDARREPSGATAARRLRLAQQDARRLSSSTASEAAFL